MVEIISKVYELNPHNNNTKLLIDFKKRNVLSEDAKFFLTHCSSVEATAMIGKKTISEKILNLFKGEKKTDTCKSFENPDSGVKWLTNYRSNG